MGNAGQSPILKALERLSRAAVCLTLFCCLMPGEIIDRIAVAVGNRVITEKEIERQIRAIALLEGKTADLSPAAKRAAAERMVEQKLISRELETGRYPTPSPEEVAPLIDRFRRGRFKSVEDFNRALKAAGLSVDDLRDELLWQRTLLAFIESRFRPLAQVSEEEVRDYFEKVVKPASEAANPAEPAALEDYRGKIEEALAGPMVDKEVDKWLAEARVRYEIVFHEEVFR